MPDRNVFRTAIQDHGKHLTVLDGGGEQELSTTDHRHICEDELVERYTRVTGSTPVMLRDQLHILAHPDVIQFTRDYLDSVEG